ncbi:early nodulin-like protein 1 [Dioscorea cayenensis subsp. rotundata]|uniref:Early nodulin-like protein 1 n=1 Tax=Dioscorea cayennensis subsp. rotundata TaxID=55577 RepID=A0AB40BHE0_DIOCR|nr:early nodulin-like protein 1 [Dioscorea cayenensis subsp. rotundata]
MARMAVTVTAAILAVILSAVSSPMTVVADNSTPPPYVNHTVGGAAGWIFNVSSNISAVNFSDWAKSQSFFLGDYLIFKTGTALPVIQTYNVTTYARCNADDDNGNETYVYDGSASDASPAVIPVPLTVEGDNYYFSGAGDDRFQCSHGMRFHIVVQHGRGLPPSLSQPPPPPYTEPPSPPVTPAPPGAGTGQEESFYNGGGRRGVGVWVKFSGFFFGVLLLMV